VFLDELDKLSDNVRECLHGVLEDGFIEVEKAGLRAKLKAETCLVAAANPLLGRFEDYRSIPEQINLPPALISRFDLILTYRDIPSDDNDRKIAQYIVDAHMGNDEFIKPEIPEDVLKKYFYYARTRVDPTIRDPEIGKYLVDTYAELRRSGPNLKITTRQLGGIIRLAKSSARLRLSSTIEKSDIEYVVELYLKSLEEIAKGQDGNVSIDNIMGVGESQKQRIKAIVKYLQDHDEDDGIVLRDLVSDLVGQGFKQPSVYRDVDELRSRGQIIRLPNGRIKPNF
jgi:replicative DNA helicase Mcm